MKCRITYPRLFVCFVLSLLLSGCALFGHGSSSLDGYQEMFGPEVNKISYLIENDYKNYIRSLPDKEKDYVGGIDYFKDAQGRIAVKIGVDLDGVFRKHVLFYDLSNKRVRVVSYNDGRYRS